MDNQTAVTSPKTQESIQVEALRGLQREIPLNDFGLPTGIYRTDLLPFHDYHPKSLASNGHDSEADSLGPPEESEDAPDGSRDGNSHKALQVDPSTEVQTTEYRIAGFPADALGKAYVPLQYDEGFPAFENGSPFWGRLDFEPVDAFQAFQRYLEMNLGIPADPEDEDDFGRPASGTRSISQLAAALHRDSELLSAVATYQDYFHLYYWNSRSHAYDLFRVAQYRKMQELRAVETQDEHYVTSRRLRAKLMTYFDSQEDFWDMLTPKVGVDFLKTLVGLERISAGIPAAGPQTAEQAAGAGTSFELHLKTIANVNRGTNVGHTIDEEGKILDTALEDAATTELLQTLIIRQGG